MYAIYIYIIIYLICIYCVYTYIYILFLMVKSGIIRDNGEIMGVWHKGCNIIIYIYTPISLTWKWWEKHGLADGLEDSVAMSWWLRCFCASLQGHWMILQVSFFSVIGLVWDGLRENWSRKPCFFPLKMGLSGEHFPDFGAMDVYLI